MYVYWKEGLLHFGRDLPRAWFARDEVMEMKGVSTHFGSVGVRYASEPSKRKIVARVELGKLREEPRVLVRFRHPEKKPIRSVKVNGKKWTGFDGEDVDVTGLRGTVMVEARF